MKFSIKDFFSKCEQIRHEYSALLGLKQLIKCLTRVTCNSCILDNVLDSSLHRLSQGDVIDVSVSDY